MASYNRCQMLYRVAVLGLMCCTTPVLAKHLGAVGQVYPVKERDAVEAILAKLKEKEATGELEQLKKDIQNRVVRHAKSPKPVMGLTTTQKRQVKLFDPSITYAEDVRTDDGQLLATAGTRINPLEYISLSKSLIFFNGDDPEQVLAVGKLVKKYGQQLRPILVRGSWFDLSNQWNMQVYFDQGGYLSQKFGLESVPTIVRQVDQQLEIAAIPASELK